MIVIDTPSGQVGLLVDTKQDIRYEEVPGRGPAALYAPEGRVVGPVTQRGRAAYGTPFEDDAGKPRKLPAEIDWVYRLTKDEKGNHVLDKDGRPTGQFFWVDKEGNITDTPYEEAKRAAQ